MIITSPKAIFIHIPKTGGTSLEKSLSTSFETDNQDFGYNAGHGFWGAHEPLSLLSRKYDLSSYLKFTIVRNPWDRLVSTYFWQHSPFKKSMSFESFINNLSFYQNQKNAQIGNHLVPQLDLLSVNEAINIDYVGRFERFNASVKRIASLLGVDSLQVPHLNKSLHNHYSTYYNSSTKDLVKRHYCHDIDFFNYSFHEA